jgi:hypothetical protein
MREGFAVPFRAGLALLLIYSTPCNDYLGLDDLEPVGTSLLRASNPILSIALLLRGRVMACHHLPFLEVRGARTPHPTWLSAFADPLTLLSKDKTLYETA